MSKIWIVTVVLIVFLIIYFNSMEEFSNTALEEHLRQNNLQKHVLFDESRETLTEFYFRMIVYTTSKSILVKISPPVPQNATQRQILASYIVPIVHENNLQVEGFGETLQNINIPDDKGADLYQVAIIQACNEYLERYRMRVYLGDVNLTNLTPTDKDYVDLLFSLHPDYYMNSNLGKNESSSSQPDISVKQTISGPAILEQQDDNNNYAKFKDCIKHCEAKYTK